MDGECALCGTTDFFHAVPYNRAEQWFATDCTYKETLNPKWMRSRIPGT